MRLPLTWSDSFDAGPARKTNTLSTQITTHVSSAPRAHSVLKARSRPRNLLTPSGRRHQQAPTVSSAVQQGTCLCVTTTKPRLIGVLHVRRIPTASRKQSTVRKCQSAKARKSCATLALAGKRRAQGGMTYPRTQVTHISLCVYVSVVVHVLRKLYGVCLWAIGYWSPLSGSTFDTSVRREGHESTRATGSLVVNIYRCVPPTACLGANASNGKVHGECMPGAYGPLCGICNGTAGFAKSRDGCRRCCNPEYNDSSFSSNPIPSSPACTEFLPVSYLFLSLYIIVLPCIPSLQVRPKRYQPIYSRNRCLDWCDRSPSFHGTEFCSELFRENVLGF